MAIIGASYTQSTTNLPHLSRVASVAVRPGSGARKSPSQGWPSLSGLHRRALACVVVFVAGLVKGGPFTETHVEHAPAAVGPMRNLERGRRSSRVFPRTGYLTPPPLGLRSRLVRPQGAAERGLQMVEQRREVPAGIDLISLCRSVSGPRPRQAALYREKPRALTAIRSALAAKPRVAPDDSRSLTVAASKLMTGTVTLPASSPGW